MDDSDVCPTEDAVQAFVEYLIEPVLPAKSSLQGTPSLTQRQLVAKQVLYLCCGSFFLHCVLELTLTFCM